MDSEHVSPWRQEIYLQTLISAPLQSCFDLARQVDAHLASAAQTGERAIAGKMAGCLELGDSVTWRASHFGVWQTLTVEITAMDSPHFFVDEMVAGAFYAMRHEHYFQQVERQTLMTDRFLFTAPLGILGWPVAHWLLRPYMRRFLLQRNAWLKYTLEDPAS